VAVVVIMIGVMLVSMREFLGSGADFAGTVRAGGDRLIHLLKDHRFRGNGGYFSNLFFSQEGYGVFTGPVDDSLQPLLLVVR